MITTYSERAADLLEGPVVQLVKDGEILERGLRSARLSRSDLLAYAHEKGAESLAEVKHAFLERSGKVTVVLRRS